MNLEKYSSISPALCELYWLPVNSRIHLKISILTFKSIYALCPSYISDLITIKSKSTCSLRSNDHLNMECPKGNMLPTFGARTFHASAPELWNSLPAEIRDIKSLSIFKQRVKTNLFQRAFRSFIIHF